MAMVRTHGLQEQWRLVVVTEYHAEFRVAVNHIGSAEKTSNI